MQREPCHITLGYAECYKDKEGGTWALQVLESWKKQLSNKPWLKHNAANKERHGQCMVVSKGPCHTLI